MSTTPSDTERVARLAAELAELGRRMAWARYELLTLSVAAPVPMPAGPEPAPPAPHPAWPQPALEPAAPEPAAPEPAESEPVRSDPSKATERQRSGQLLPWAGGAITLVGIVMFLVLAASRGWFGVPARLVAGAVLGLALVAVAHRVHRRADSPAGALALAGTGIAALYLDVATATARYHYLPDAVGLLLGLVVAGAGLALADRWRAEPLGCASVLGVGVLLPALYGGSLPLLVALALVPQLAAAPVVLRRGWTGLALVAAFFPVLYGSIAVFGAILTESLAGSTNSAPTVTAVAAVFLVGLVLAVLGSNRLHPVAAAARLAAASVPVLAMATVYPDRRGALLAGLVGLAALTVAAPLGRLPLPRPHALARATAATVGAVAIFEATVLLFGGAALTGVVLGQALAMAVLAAVSGRRGPLVAAVAYGLVGVLRAVYRDAPVRALVDFPAAPYLSGDSVDRAALLTGLALSVLVVALATALVVASVRLNLASADAGSAWLWLPAGAAGLYGAAGTVISAALLLVPAQPGFIGGHAVVTISWTLAALVLLARGIERPALRVTGLVLIAAAVAKLVLFDLIALDGLARVAAFLGAGLLMLAAGVRYARLVARSQE
ncbi:MAG TPA: DUF2339 domain-containing protein [Pseudonocardia sp.]|nr:DUF2339 domain-containing protein [Pseudonocardia sp.]